MKRWSGLAIAGFVLSLASFPAPGAAPPEIAAGLHLIGILGSILAVTFSAIGVSQVSQGSRTRGKGLAIAGLVISIIALLIYLLTWGRP